MSTKRRKRSGPSRESLSVDLLLEIVARADVMTLVRCAATGRTLRRAIREPAFQRRLAAEDGFDPALLLAVAYRKHDSHRNVTTQRVIHTPSPKQLRARLDADSLQAPFKPVASREGLRVLRRLQERPNDKVELRACDTFTGHVTSLPPTTLPNAYLYVVLAVDHTERSFELLVAGWDLQHQTFSSKNRQWSDIRDVNVPCLNRQWDSYRSVVIVRTVYWPCRVNSLVSWKQIVALDVDAGEATMIKLPRSFFSKSHLLLARVRGRLCLLAQESRGIAMWTLTSSVAATWSRQVVISNMKIKRQAGLDAYPLKCTLEAFGERSGVMILNLGNKGNLLRLHLGSKEEAPVVVTWLSRSKYVVDVKSLFLHDIHLISLLQAMKHF